MKYENIKQTKHNCFTSIYHSTLTNAYIIKHNQTLITRIRFRSKVKGNKLLDAVVNHSFISQPFQSRWIKVME